MDVPSSEQQKYGQMMTTFLNNTLLHVEWRFDNEYYVSKINDIIFVLEVKEKKFYSKIHRCI